MGNLIIFWIGWYIIWNFISLIIWFITSKICTFKTEKRIWKVFMILFWILYVIFLFNSDIERRKCVLVLICLFIFHLIFQMITIHVMMSNNRRFLLFMMWIISLIMNKFYCILYLVFQSLWFWRRCTIINKKWYILKVRKWISYRNEYDWSNYTHLFWHLQYWYNYTKRTSIAKRKVWIDWWVFSHDYTRIITHFSYTKWIKNFKIKPNIIRWKICTNNIKKNYLGVKDIFDYLKYVVNRHDRSNPYIFWDSSMIKNGMAWSEDYYPYIFRSSDIDKNDVAVRESILYSEYFYKAFINK